MPPLVSRRSTASAPQFAFPPGPRYRLAVRFDSAQNLPVGDLTSFSSDPYVRATLRFPDATLPKLHYRTPTVRSSRDPVWAVEWVVASVPTSGLTLKVKVLDEDPGEHDDVLGVARYASGHLHPPTKPGPPPAQAPEPRQTLSYANGVWVGFLRLVLCAGRATPATVVVHIHISPEGVPASGQEDELGRPYTVSPNWWSQHSSPLIGIITHTTGGTPPDSTPPTQDGAANADTAALTAARTPHVQRAAFLATKIQLSGPLPPNLCQRYVAFRPIIKTFYTKRGLLGIALNHALKHQYRTVYSYDKATTYGVAQPDQLARCLLDFTHWGDANRLYTYIITLDGEWRFTETGPQFGIQMLSKHTMHSCVSVYVAFAGEFYIRPPSTAAAAAAGGAGGGAAASPAATDTTDCPPQHQQRNVGDYVLVIDNDSGTYRPPKQNLSALHAFMLRSLPGLPVEAPDAFDEAHIAEKAARAAERAHRGHTLFHQLSRRSSGSHEAPSSSARSELEHLRTGREGLGRRLKNLAWRKVEKSGDAPASSGIGDASGLSSDQAVRDDRQESNGRGKEKLPVQAS